MDLEILPLCSGDKTGAIRLAQLADVLSPGELLLFGRGDWPLHLA